MLYANFTTLSFIEPELFSIEVLHCGNGEFHVFCEKWWKLLKKFSSHPKNDVAVAETHFLTHYRLFYLVCHRSYTRSKCCFNLFYAESVGVVTSGHVTKMAVTPFDPQWPITPYCTQTSRLYLLQNRSYCRLKFYMVGIGNFAFFFAKNSGNY